MLQSDTAKVLYHEYASKMPIYDYHCHLNPKEIWEDIHFKNITEVWLGGDHYKWRAMRSNGIDERYITGDASDREKVSAYVNTLQYAPGNPLYHWSHLELQRYFGIYEPLTPKTEEDVWNRANKVIASEDFSARAIIKQSNVKMICTTDDPTSNLEYHTKIKNEGKMECKVLPAFRPDNAVNIQGVGFLDYIQELGIVAGKRINDYEDLLEVLIERIEFFHQNGCRLSDHGLEFLPYTDTNKEKAGAAFKAALEGKGVDEKQKIEYMAHILQFLAWSMQSAAGLCRYI